MSLDQFLDLFFRSNVLVIEVLFGIVLAGVIFLTFRSFSRPETLSSEVNLQGLEDGIKKILENYSPGSKPPVASTIPVSEGGDSNGLMEEMATQIERLKLQLMQKSEEVEQLKSSVSNNQLDPALFQEPGATPAPVAAAPGTSAGSGNTTVLEEKIKDLEARLSEYSIIEDDIADLSFYKEETVRLQTEVDKLKAKLAEYEAGGAPAAAPTPAPTPIPISAPQALAPAPTPLEVAPTPIETPAKQELPPAAIASDVSAVDDDIMAEFERAVAEQKTMTAAQKSATEVPPPSPEEVQEPASEPVEGGINLDKMLSEVGQLPENPSDEAMNVLEQALDTEKLLEEATGMEKIDTEALNDFDEFLKKEGA